MTNLYALDIATKTGWASLIDGNLRSGVFDTSEYDDEGQRGFAWGEWLFGKLVNIDFVYIETAFNTGFGKTDYRLNGMQYIAHMIAWHCHGVERRTVPPTTLKKHTTGSGKASKKQMVEAVVKWGLAPADDNEADALALLDYACHQLNLPPISGVQVA
ncbi:MAG: hypothetical protein ACR2PS_18490 [Pseudomonadales bacterium]